MGKTPLLCCCCGIGCCNLLYSIGMGIQSCDLQFEAEVARDAHGLRYLGPTLRGFFGYALKNLVCVVSHGQCDCCILEKSCLYTRVFEGRPPSARRMMTRYSTVPQPFVLCVPGPDEPPVIDGRLQWGIRLFGDVGEMAPYIIESFMRHASRGLGPRRVGFRLKRVYDGHTGATVWNEGFTSAITLPEIRTMRPRSVPGGRSSIRFTFQTPVHIRVGGSFSPTPSGLDIVLAGRRRYSLLRYFYGFGGDSEPSQEPRIEAEDFKTEEVRLHPWHIDRYSGRQHRKVPLNGSTGSVTITGPWEQAGAWLGSIEQWYLGKYTSFGFGRISWQAV